MTPERAADPTPEALEEASKWFSWPDSRDRLAFDLDRFRAEGVEAERERCVEAVKAEPELPGEPPYDVMEMLRTDPAEVMRIVCRLTKREIIKRIREQP